MTQAARLVAEAALNNAEWCDAFCRAHGVDGRFDETAWSSAERTPPYYPDAVTLMAGCSAESLLHRVDASAGCSIKDSFADLDLGAHGFDVLFEAEWVCWARAAEANAPAWSPVASAEELERWEAAWGESPGQDSFFRRELLTDPRIEIFACVHGAGIRAGAVANRSRAVIGISNVFALEGELEAAWSGAASAAQAVWGPMPVVGYGEGESLEAARGAAFEPIGSLAIWVKRSHG